MKIGIYGGTFSPPHNGHVNAARMFAAAESLDKLLIIPTFIPPHKTETSAVPAEERLEMCRLAFTDDNFDVSDIEVRRKGKSYTFDTLTELKEMYRSDDFYLLCGTDMLLSFEKWYRFADILSMCTVVCMRREENAEMGVKLAEKIVELKEQCAADVRLIDAPPLEVSSTEIREKLSRGENVNDLLPTDVYRYIKEKGLYLNV